VVRSLNAKAATALSRRSGGGEAGEGQIHQGHMPANGKICDAVVDSTTHRRDPHKAIT